MRTSLRDRSARSLAWPALLAAILSTTGVFFSGACTEKKVPVGGLWTRETLAGSVSRGEAPKAVLVLNEREVLPPALQVLDKGGPREGAERAKARAAYFSRAKDTLLARVPSLDVIQRYDELPLLAVSIRTQEAVDALFSQRELARIHREEFLAHDLVESLPLVNQQVAQARGYLGSGTAVAVLDTGVDYTNAAFGSCSAAGLPAGCKVTFAADFAPDDGKLDTDGHGTNVAAIVVGVAPETRILALDVFNQTSASSLDIIKGINWVIANQSRYNIVAINLSVSAPNAFNKLCDTDSVFSTAIAAARDAGVLTIVASGNNGFTNMISNPGCVSSAVSVGAVYDTDVGPKTFPNCSDPTTAADQIACFSNSAPFLTLLAPGADITAAGHTLSGTSQAAPHVAGAVAVLRAAFPTNSTAETVHRLAAGPLILDSRNGVSTPRLDLDPATETCYLAASPRNAEVPPAGGTFTIDLDDTSPEGCSWTVTSNVPWVTIMSGGAGMGDASVTYGVTANTGSPRSGSINISGQTFVVSQGADDVAPTGSVRIEGGTLVGTTNYIGTRDVTLTLSAVDSSGVAAMCVSNRATCTAWEPFATSRLWTLSPESGPKTVSVWFKDTRGNVTATPATDTITLDVLPPSSVSLTSNGSTGQVELSWTAATDTMSGLAGYRLVVSSALPASCSDGTVIYDGMATSFTHMGLVDGTTSFYRLCAYDAVGNVAPGSTLSARPAPEYDAPVGSISVDVPVFNTRKFTARYEVPLVLSATDVSGVTQMCVSNKIPCPKMSWEPYATAKAWTLPNGETTRTVYAWFMDAYGNVSTSPVTDRISVDLSPPSAPRVQTSGSDGRVVITWSGASDSSSGIAGYKIVYQEGASAPANCTLGTLLYDGTGTSFVHMPLQNGESYNYLVCAYDNVGNMSSGGSAAGRPAPEYAPPTGLSVQINGWTLINGVKYVSNPNVNLSLTGTDPAGVFMCIANTSGNCASWEPFVPSKAWTLPTGTGEKTVYAYFKDGYNNVATLPATDKVTLDQSPPLEPGGVTATGSAQQVVLSWNAAADANSGTAGYKVVFSTSANPPANCAGGTVAYSGPATTFTHTGLTDGQTYYYRVCSVDALNNISAGTVKSARPAPEYDPPTSGSVLITNTFLNGNTRYIGSTGVTLSISAMDQSMIEMCVSNTTTCTTWEPLAAMKSWTVPAGTGPKQVFVTFRDIYGNVASPSVSDTAYLDQNAPVDQGMLAATGGNARVDLAWSAGTDALAGVGGYVLVYSTASSPASCLVGTVAYEGPATTFAHLGLLNGTTYYYRVCVKDNVGNLSVGKTNDARTAVEYDPPVNGTVSVTNAITNGGSRFVGTYNVTLALSASDASPIQMCVSNTTTCTAWESFSATKSWTLTNGAGTKTVYVTYRDTFGNLATMPATDTVVVDLAAPSEVTGLSTSGNGGQVTLSWNESSDAGAGVGGYKVVYGTSTPSNCNSGTVLYSGAAATYLHTGLSNGTTYYYRVCAFDNVGNLTAGATATAKPAPEYDPPTDGAVAVANAVVRGSTSYVGSPNVTLNIFANDLSPMQMCVSNTATCSSWETFSATKSWTLTSGTGAKTVSVWFRDIYLNTNTTPATVAVTLDVTLPGEASGLTASGSAGQIMLTWNPGTDATSGVGGYKIVFSTSSAPQNCSSGTVAYNGVDTVFTHSGLTNGATYYYRLCTYDAVNNMSAGITTSAKPAPDYDPPVNGAVVINNTTLVGANRFIGTANVTLSISAQDASAIQMCVSNTATCTSWETLAATKTWTLTTGTGAKTVSVFFRDIYNNVAAAPATDSVTLDVTLPSEASGLTATGSAGQIALSWNAAVDATSGVGGYKIVYSTSSSPGNCSSGSVAYSGPDTSFIHSGLTNGATYYYRLCTYDNVNNMSAGILTSAKPAPDYDPPANGAVVVANATSVGATRYIGGTAVTLNISANDASAMQMCVSNTTTCTSWENFSATKNWAFTAGTGVKTVYVYLRDVFNNVAPAPATDTVTLDQTLPSDPSGLTATGGGSSVILSWTAATDATSGIGGYKVVYATSGNPAASCTNGTVAYTGPNTTFTQVGLTDGATYYFRVCALDNVNNISAGVVASARPAPEYDPPANVSVLVNGAVIVGASKYIGTTNVTLGISATDASAMQMCVSNTATCTAWENYSATKTWTLTTGTGVKTVSVFFRDIYGNVTAAPATDTVTLDVTNPSDVSGLTATGSDGMVTLSWNAATDATSGIGNYKIVYATASAPANCSSGTAIYTGPATTFDHAGLVNGTVYYYRVCALDNVNNSSAGVTANARPAPEYDPPASGSVLVMNSVTVGSTRYIGTSNVTLAISAIDQSMIQMCVSNTSTCTTWEAMTGTRSWSLTTGTGAKTVSVFFRDVYGNVAASPATDSVTVDTTPPAEVTGLTATGGFGSVSLSWTDAVDALSGTGGYKVVSSTTATPAANCTNGTTVYSGPATSLTQTGLTNGTVYYYRVCALDNVNNISAGVAANARPAPEYNPPADGSVIITGTVVAGAGRYVGSTSVTLAINATDENAMQMCVSNTNSCATWETYATSKNWTLTTGTGAKTVYVFFRDAYFNTTVAPATDTVTLDQTNPTDISGLTLTGSSGAVALSWNAGSDASSGIAGYKVVYSTTSAPAANCTNGSQAYNGGETSFTHTPVIDGTTYYYRVCAVDNVGNVAYGVTGSARPAPEYDPPTSGSVLINNTQTNGTTRFVGSTAVTLSISAMDQSMMQMCVSNTNACTTWETLASTKNWTLTTGSGAKTVYVFFRDVYGNVAASPATDGVTLDLVAPTEASGLTATGSTGTVSLSWTAATDASSGMGGYKVVYSTTGSPAATCSNGTLAYNGPATSFAHTTGVIDGTTYYYRVCAVDAVGNTSAGVTTSARPAPEYNPPTALSVTVTGTYSDGTTRYIGTTGVTLAISATDESNMQMCVSNTASCSSWETYSTTKSWSFAAGTGSRIVYVYFRDVYGNAAASPATDTVVLDQTVPGNPSGLTATGSGATVALSWTAGTDANSGVGGYKVVYSTGAAPTNCSSGTVGYVGPATSFSQTGLLDGTVYYFRVCTLDNVNNISAGVTASARPAPEYDPPANGTVSVVGAVTNGATRYVSSVSVTLAISATDASSMQMCISNTSTCTSWEPYATTKSWGLSAGAGAKTVYVSLRDVYGNTAASPATDNVTVDLAAPTDVTGLTASGSAGTVALSWNAATDASSGVGGYKVVYSTSSSPSNCSSGSIAYTGPATTFTHQGLTDGLTHYYRVCAYDNVNNTSAGVITNARPAPEYDPPTGTVTVNGTTDVNGTRYIGSTNVSLILTATDVSPVQMCVSNTNSCTAWETFAGTRSWTLTTGTGVKTVYVFLRDSYNNLAAAVTDTVTLDTTVPSDGSLSVTGGDTQAALTWTSAVDVTSGVAGYKVVYSTSGSPSANCASGTLAYNGPDLTFTHAGLLNGTTYNYRVCAYDKVGNTSAGVTGSVRPEPEYIPPTGTVSIASGAAYINSTSVALAISATDASGLSQMCVSNTGSCTAWETYATTKNWTVTTGDALKTISVWFRDIYNNQTPSPTTTQVTLDMTAPTAFTATATGDVQQVILSWTASSDATSGLWTYTVQSSTSATPASCIAGTRPYAGTDLTFTDTGLTSGTTMYYRICAWDNAGNSSSVTTSAQVQ